MTVNEHDQEESVTQGASGEPGSSNPRETDHPTGAQQAAENEALESPA